MPDKIVLNRSDIDLVADLRSGSQKAYERLFDKYSPVILVILNNLKINEQKTEEVLLACFMKMRARINEFDAEKVRLFTWVLNITRSTISETCMEEKNLLEIQAKSNYVQNRGTLSNSDLLGLLIIDKKTLEGMNVFGDDTNHSIRKMIKTNIDQLKK